VAGKRVYGGKLMQKIQFEFIEIFNFKRAKKLTINKFRKKRLTNSLTI